MCIGVGGCLKINASMHSHINVCMFEYWTVSNCEFKVKAELAFLKDNNSDVACFSPCCD